AWSLEATAAELLSILNLPKREPMPSFHLTVTQQKDKQYHLRAACSLNGETSTTMDISSLQTLIPHACKALEETQVLPPSLEELPKMLHNLLLPPRIAVHLGVARERAQQRRQRRRWGLPLLLDLSAAEELVEWPWELMCDEYNFLGMEPHVPLVRVLDAPHADGDRHLSRPLSLLIVSSEPKGLEGLNVKSEVTKLKKALRWMGRYHYQYDWVQSGSWERVQAALIEKRPNAVHFIGHGSVNPVNGMGELIFCDSDGYPDPISARELGLLFKDHGIELLFLNACSSAQVVGNQPGAAVAVSLLKQGIPNVLAMQYAIEDEAAVLLTETFYKELSFDKSFAEALARARMALYAKWRDKLTWATPVLYIS
nr:CHAT domain-containing protein [Ardenticatenales bacterium]